MDTEKKKRILNALTIPIIICATENWVIQKKHKN